MDDRPVAVPTDFEREKWEAELALRRRELDLKEQEQSRLASDAKRSRWWNPLFIAIIGATIAAVGSVFVSWMNGAATQKTETLKAESARILEAIKANDPDKAKQNLRFLIATGLISQPTAGKILAYLDEQPPGQGPVLPSAGNVGDLFQRAFTAGQPNSTPAEIRIFAGPDQYPPQLFKAYGIVAFPSRPAPDEMARYLMICAAFASTLLDLSGLKSTPAQQEMVTVWPIESDAEATGINHMPGSDDICKNAVQHYGLPAAQTAIIDARKSHAELSGKGPFLLAWSPANSKGQPNSTVLVLDLSDVTTPEQAEASFSYWSTTVQANPELWDKGWNTGQLKTVIRLWADKYGPQILKIFGVANSTR